MKTKVRIFSTVFTLAFAGVLNANATVKFDEKNSGLIFASENSSFLNEKITLLESEMNGAVDYLKEARLVTRWIVDMAEAKATQKVMERGYVEPSETISLSENEAANESSIETTNFLEEARLMTKLNADKAEAKATQKVMERGYVAPSETINFSKNKAAFENVVETNNFLEEARLMTKLIADKEEDKAVQKVMERGFVDPSETINSYDNEAAIENVVETTDFLEEARLMTKLNADKEEAKAVQKLIAEIK